MYNHDLTAAYVRELLDYNPDTGVLTWKASKSGRRNAIAGTLSEWHGVRRLLLTIDYKSYKAHRIVWLWMTGEWPCEEIDHINRNASDNRWVNLRVVNRSVQSLNRGRPRNNTSGTKGVYWDRFWKRWKLRLDGKYIGCYRTKSEARRAAKLAFFQKRKPTARL